MSPGEAYQQKRAFDLIRQARTPYVTGHMPDPLVRGRLLRDAQRALDEANMARELERAGWDVLGGHADPGEYAMAELERLAIR